MEQTYLIKYGEIAIKGKNRHLFEEALVRQIRLALERLDGEFETTWEQGRIYVEGGGAAESWEVIDALSKVFGIVGICPVKKVEDRGLEALGDDMVRFLEEGEYDLAGRTFKVVTRRARKSYPTESMEVNAYLGGRILDWCPQAQVDVHEPETVFHVEIRDKIYIYSRVIPGPGGMPVGTGGRSMLLLSGGIDSPVAGYMMAKRGVVLDAVYFHAPPYTSERAKQKVIDLARTVSAYTGPIWLRVVNFTDIQLYIYDECPHEELTIIMRRYMMRIAEHFALENECLGLVTGESIGQVASQTMQSLLATNDVCTLPVYRPLIGFDKNDIIDIAKKIDTFETSILPYEDCCTIFVAKHPVTKPNVNIIRRSEKKLSEKIDELVKTAVETAELIRISNGIEKR